MHRDLNFSNVDRIGTILPNFRSNVLDQILVAMCIGFKPAARSAVACDCELLHNSLLRTANQAPVAFECMHQGKPVGKVYLRFLRKAVTNKKAEAEVFELMKEEVLLAKKKEEQEEATKKAEEAALGKEEEEEALLAKKKAEEDTAAAAVCVYVCV